MSTSLAQDFFKTFHHQDTKAPSAELSRAERDYSAVLNTINVTYLLMRENKKGAEFLKCETLRF
jgi:hypothetical protein